MRAPRLLLPRPLSMAPPGSPGRGAAGHRGSCEAGGRRAALSKAGEWPARLAVPSPRQDARRAPPPRPRPPLRAAPGIDPEHASLPGRGPVSRVPHTPAPRPASCTPFAALPLALEGPLPGPHALVPVPAWPLQAGPGRCGSARTPLAMGGYLTCQPAPSLMQTVRTCVSLMGTQNFHQRNTSSQTQNLFP